MRKNKIGRNDLCPCGSGLKYKKCFCHSQSHSHSKENFKSNESKIRNDAKELLRLHQQGHAKPIISAEFQGIRFTAVGKSLYYSKKHKTFIDFLGDYIQTIFGLDWYGSEIAKKLNERHPVLQWLEAIGTIQKKNIEKEHKGFHTLKSEGVALSYYGLAYNIYLLQHNVELQNYLVQRLKYTNSFYAAYYETYVAAWFILSGFTLKLENEKDPTCKHPEFIASRNGQTFSVEAKSRQSGKSHFDVGTQLYKALCKDLHHTRIIFINMNIDKGVDTDDFLKQVTGAIKTREDKLTINGLPAPPAFVYITNQTFNFSRDKINPPKLCLTVGFKINDFGYCSQFNSYTSAYKAFKKYALLHDVQNAILSYSIPSTFDGEVPQFSFGQASRSFSIGMQVKLSDGRNGTLQSGCVNVKDKSALLIIKIDSGDSCIFKTELSDEELAAYHEHPETFFGIIQQPPKILNSKFELFMFIVESYKNTSRDKLLEMIHLENNDGYLHSLCDDELLYFFAEGLTRNTKRC